MSGQTPQFRPERSGVPGLDDVLGGGLPANNLVFVIGAPGAGKTVLAMQIACAAVADGKSVLFLTSFSESHDKLVAHMRTFSFFEPTYIGQNITLLSILSLLQGDTEDAIREVARTVRQSRAEIVIIDGFGGLRDYFASDQQRNRFLQMIGTQLTYIGTTLLVTYEFSAESAYLNPAELPIADTIIALHFNTVGRQHRRMLEVRKVRGQRPLGGLHSYDITSAGCIIYPRLEQQLPPTLPAPSTEERAAFGLADLDRLLSGGLNRGTSTLLAGALGAGKTLLGLQFILAGVAVGEPGLIVTLNESREQLEILAANFGLDLEGAIVANQVRVIRRAPIEVDVDELAMAIQTDLVARPVRRFLLDGVLVLQKVLDSDNRTENYLAALTEITRAQGITSLMAIEINRIVEHEVDFSSTPVGVLGDNVVLLRQFETNKHWHRTLSVLRMRFSSHDQGVHEFTIDRNGFQFVHEQATANGSSQLKSEERRQSQATASRRRRSSKR